MRNVRRWRLFRLIVLAVVTAGTVTVAAVPVAAGLRGPGIGIPRRRRSSTRNSRRHRAARSFAPAQIGSHAPLGLWGYSGGGFATAAAAQMQPEYAPELELRGIAMGGVIADFNASLQTISGQAFSGWLPFGLAALRRSYPQADINQYLGTSGLAYADAVQNECAGAAVASGPYFAPLSRFEASPGSLSVGAFHSFAHSVSPIGLPGTPAAPVYLYHGVSDELVPVTAARQLVHRYRAAGADVLYVEDDKDHAAEQSYGVPGAVTFLTRRLSLIPRPRA
ncbi:lipase family protein [Streptomyces sp. NBC_00885]|uniref:lipase family protein n=1 Tax=Streptomyces sp. NBC_00885 TaxID=2975857 RepID=UPI00386E777D|nr:lipase family protein [Streptomyces sp. NBC_00885]